MTRGSDLLRLTLLLALLTLPALAQAPADHVLTNADVAKMVKAGVPESIVVREIQMSRTDFGTSPTALIDLKKQGASEAVLGAVLDSRMGVHYQGSEAQPGARVLTAASTGPNHLPTFEADVRVNATKHEKVSMGHNQIKVEQSGVPIFSLKWKDPKSTNSNK
jgi:hypothetical protein